MGLEQVKDEILQEAREEAAEIREEAEEKADQILEDARKEADRIREKMEGEIEEEKQAMEKKAMSNARMEAKQQKLREKQKRLDEVFLEFTENLDIDNRENFVSRCIEKAGFEPERLKASPGFEEVAEELGLEFEKAEIDGVILESQGGERSIDFTLDSIAENYRKNHRKEVAERLFDR